MTDNGSSSTLTTIAPRMICATTPPTRPTDSHVRSRRRGTRTSEPSTARITAIDTMPVINRFMNSTCLWNSSGATNWFCSQSGQSEHPRPEPVSRTAAPVTMMNDSASRANRVMRR